MLNTRKIYYFNGEQREFDAIVLDVIPFKNGYCIVLDQTCFFPEGGGQQSDTGTVGKTVISDVFESNEAVYHFSESFPDCNVGDTVHCSVNWEKRFPRMQAHSGEHLLSGIVHKKYGFNNVGFHMDDAVMTVDFDGVLTKEQLREVEREANDAIYNDVAIKTYFLKDSSCEPDYRSKLADLTNPRLVDIDGYDICACCAPHVSSTGKIGIIKILSSASHRGGIRITLICGVTAYRVFAARYDDILTLSDLLCAPHDAVPQAVRGLLDRMEDMKREEAFRKSEQMKKLVDGIKPTNGNICLFVDGASTDDIRKIAVMLKDSCGGFCVVLGGDDESGYAYAITSPRGGLRAYSSVFNGALSGRGSGKDDMLQGRFCVPRTEIEEYFSKKEI